MTLDRRQLLASGLGALTLAGSVPRWAGAADGTIKVGFLMDLTGPLQVYGKPKSNCIQLAVDQVNAQGGLLGRKLELVQYDTQSQTQLYAQFAQQLVLKDRVSVVFGAVTSAAREIARPVLDKAKTLYFYNTVYEGGVCDRNVFVTGPTPQQQLVKLIPYMIQKFGKRGYILAADYNFGHDTADWVKRIAKDNGGEIVAAEFFPLEVNNFAATIAKIQESKPDFVHNVFVGPAHESFYGQWAAAGVNKKIAMSSSTLGDASELQRLPPTVSEGLITVANYFDELQTPAAESFRKQYQAKFGSSRVDSVIAHADYYGLLLWAEGVRRAKSVEQDAVIKALEGGVSVDGPSGRFTIDPQSHHCLMNIYLGTVQNGSFQIGQSWEAVSPSGDDKRCDLIARPTTNTQFGVMQ